MILAWSLALMISGPASPAPPVVLRPAPKPRVTSTTATEAALYVPHSDLRDPFAGAGGRKTSSRSPRTTGLKDPFAAPTPRRKRAQAQRTSSAIEPAPRRALVDPFAVTPSGRPSPARLSDELKDPFGSARSLAPVTTPAPKPVEGASAAACPGGRAATASGCSLPQADSRPTADSRSS